MLTSCWKIRLIDQRAEILWGEIVQGESTFVGASPHDESKLLVAVLQIGDLVETLLLLLATSCKRQIT
jgi:hypothetical protein